MNACDADPTIDLGPAAELVAAIVRGIREDQLSGPTPCPEFTVGDLLDHLSGLALAFTQAARKEGTADGPGPSADGSRLPTDWQAVVPERLTALALAWRDPSAWSGPTAAGGLEMGGAEAGIVALDELVVHGWDLAVSTGQHYEPDGASVQAARSFVEQFSGPGTDAMRQGLFGPELAAPVAATPWEELLALAGRDPRDPLQTEPAG